MGCVYLAKNTINGKCYVGKTIHDLPYRKGGHAEAVRQGSTLIFHNALRKYGLDAFEWTTLTEDDDDEFLCFMECKWIKRLGTKSPGGYNMTEGGEGAVNLCEEAIEAHRLSVIRSWQDADDRREAFREKFCGKTYEQLHGPEKAKEMRRKQSEVKIGTIQTPESNAKRSASLSGKRKSEEAVKNMRLACAAKTEDARRNSLANLSLYNNRRALEGISEDTRRMLKLSHLGNLASEETKAKMRESQARRRERERTACMAT